MAENSFGFQAAFESLAKLQETQFSVLRADLAEVKSDVKRVDSRIDSFEAWRVQTDQLLEGMKSVVELLSKIGDRKNLAILGGAFSLVSFAATLLARLF